jgi:hypothetical protein
MNILNTHVDVEVDDTMLAKISDVEEFFNEAGKAGPTFVETN